MRALNTLMNLSAELYIKNAIGREIILLIFMLEKEC